MKVKITHSLDLNEVPEKVGSLIEPTKKRLEDCAKHLQSLSFLLHDSPEPAQVSLAVMHLEILRRSLGSIDVVLEEAQSMLTGVDNYNQQVAAKESLEASLAEQEKQAAQPPSEPPVHKNWNAEKRRSELVEDEGDAND